MSKKRAFTMVELIFVIVILGILAAVAVPKLNASREDAQIAQIIANVRTILGDIHTYFAAQGTIPKGFAFSKLTNVPLDGECLIVDGGKNDCCLHFKTDADDCVVIFHQFTTVSSACIKAVEKMDFLRGDDGFHNHPGFTSPGAHCWPTRPRVMSTLFDATAGAGGTYKGIVLHLDDGKVDFE